MNDTARVILWGSDIGAVTWVEDRALGVFQYTSRFARSGIQPAPLMMPLREFPYEFPALARETFRGLPGLLADSLPDDFGNAVINEWLASQGRSADSLNPVERLCYTGRRGMGALEFEPATLGPPTADRVLEVAKLADLADRILRERAALGGVLKGVDDKKTIEDILRVGTSAGGARAKAILAWNPQTGEFRSGQVAAQAGFEYWLMKFDGVAGEVGTSLATPQGFGSIEYAYHLMAVEAGVVMSPCRLHHEGGRSHFMTKRFDRTASGDKLHLQSLGAMAHVDYRQPSSTSYEQAMQVMRRIGLPQEDLEEQFLRAVLNVVGCNQDDHVKNIALLMDRNGVWRLSPAFDVAYAQNPGGQWTHQHQMSVNGKRSAIGRTDLIALAHAADIKTPRANAIIDRVVGVFDRWPDFATRAQVSAGHLAAIKRSLQTRL